MDSVIKAEGDGSASEALESLFWFDSTFRGDVPFLAANAVRRFGHLFSFFGSEGLPSLHSPTRSTISTCRFIGDDGFSYERPVTLPFSNTEPAIDPTIALMLVKVLAGTGRFLLTAAQPGLAGTKHIWQQ